MSVLVQLSGNEKLQSSTLSLDGDILGFWAWAFRDLKDNTIRGVFAEWMVACLLGIPHPPRQSWAEVDLVASNGLRIEVKASAYLQSWKQKKLSRIAFSGLRSRRWDAESGVYVGGSTYHADVYVFCVQIETDPDRWDALDLDQWRFFLVTRDQVQSENRKTLSLKGLMEVSTQLRAAQFQSEARSYL
jgi:hypothetical protein